MPPPTMIDVPMKEIYEVLNFGCDRLRAAPAPPGIDWWNSNLEALAAAIDKLKNVSDDLMIPVPSGNVAAGRVKISTRGSRVIVGCSA